MWRAPQAYHGRLHDGPMVRVVPGDPGVVKLAVARCERDEREKAMNFKTLVVSALALAFVSGVVTPATVSAATRTVGNATSVPCVGTYPTIQDAVNAASPLDTISVCKGTYPELVGVNKTLTIQGAQVGVDARTRAVPVTSESVVGSGDGAFQILANKVVIDGFTIQGVNNPPNLFPGALGAGIWTNPGFSGTSGGHQIKNNIIQNNIIGIELDNDGTFQTVVERNLIQNNNQAGPDGGTGIDTNFGLTNAVINSNKFVGNANSGMGAFAPSSGVTVSNNEFAGNRRAIGWFGVTSSSISSNNIHNSTDAATADIRIFGGVSSLSVTCNNLATGAGRGIRINDDGFCSPSTCPDSAITINNNNISGYPVAGLEVDSGAYSGGPGSLNAKNNWWGSSTGPTIASNPGGTGEPIIDPDGVVAYSPFLATFSTCAPVPQIGPPTDKDQCKNDGWKSFNVPRKFKNQGDCIQFVNTGK
jgi:parallel beta helix pectate lyase-like protein